jgi:hypothetical protein
MFWDPMTIDEFARSRQADGMKVVRIDNIWWTEVRPFFFRPLFPFSEIYPSPQKYPLEARIGGVLHLVPSGVPANSTMNFFVYDNLQNYSLNSVSHRRRRIINQGIKYFTAKRITDLTEFIDTAHEVYISFHNRTRYSYKNNRVDKRVFTEWAHKLFDQKKIVKLGAYHSGKLSAIELSYRVGNIIFGDTLFANNIGLNKKVTDFVLHTLREEAGKSDARYFFVGLPTGVRSLDSSKLNRGCKIINMPAYYHINPLALSIAKIFMKSSYQKLQDIIAPNLAAIASDDNQTNLADADTD